MRRREDTPDTLRTAARALLTFHRRLDPLTTRRRLADDVREAMGATADGIASDLRLLRGGLDCPATSPAGAFLDP